MATIDDLRVTVDIDVAPALRRLADIGAAVADLQKLRESPLATRRTREQLTEKALAVLANLVPVAQAAPMKVPPAGDAGRLHFLRVCSEEGSDGHHD